MSLINKYKIYFDKIVDLKIWKWIYYCGIGLAGIIFLINFYNLIIYFLWDFRLVGKGYEYFYQGFLSFYARKCEVRCTINGISFSVFPFFVLVLLGIKHFYKLLLIPPLSFLFLVLSVYFFKLY
jgi:hypothetical protein